MAKTKKEIADGKASKAATAKKKRPTLEEALKKRKIKSIAKSKPKAKKKKAKKKVRHASPLTNPQQAKLDRERKVMKGRK